MFLYCPMEEKEQPLSEKQRNMEEADSLIEKC